MRVLVILFQTRVLILFLFTCLRLEVVVMLKFCAGTFLAFFSIFGKLVLLESLKINLYTEGTLWLRSSIRRKWEWILPFQIGKGQKTPSYVFYLFNNSSGVHTSWCFRNTICYSFYIFWAENVGYNFNFKVTSLNKCHLVANTETQDVFHNTICFEYVIFSSWAIIADALFEDLTRFL